VPLAYLAVLVVAVAGTSAYLVRDLSGGTKIQTDRGQHVVIGGAVLPAAGALVPAYDLFSDPVFPTLDVGYAIERHATSAGVTEALARSEDGGHTWRLVGSFPFDSGYFEVQFVSISSGYAFGPAGLAVTHNGGATWTTGEALGGRLQRVAPIGADVWATYATCSGPPEQSTVCSVHLAVSRDSGVQWTSSRPPTPLSESYDGGDILARVDLDEAYLVSYGPTGGGLARTTDGGKSWRTLPDPCSNWPVVDLATPGPEDLWMICGGPSVAAGAACAKAVLQSSNGGRTWRTRAYTGYGPPDGPLGSSAPVGEIWYAGTLSQLATVNMSEAWIGVSGVGVLVTVNGGRDWQLADGMPDSGGRAGIGVTLDSPLGRRVHGWAIEFHQGVWRSNDAVHWQLVDGT
jgi:hypothetical protein